MTYLYLPGCEFDKCDPITMLPTRGECSFYVFVVDVFESEVVRTTSVGGVPWPEDTVTLLDTSGTPLASIRRPIFNAGDICAPRKQEHQVTEILRNKYLQRRSGGRKEKEEEISTG